jgi:hypothetical protein
MSTIFNTISSKLQHGGNSQIAMRLTAAETLTCVSPPPARAKRRLALRASLPPHAEPEQEACLRKIILKLDSPVQDAASMGLFVLIGSLATGTIFNNVVQLFSFVSNDSLTQTIKLLLRH